MEIIKHIVIALTSPLTFSIFLLGAGVVFGYLGQRRLKKTCKILAIVWFFVWSQPYSSDLLLYPLEHLKKPQTATVSPQYIHVLACYYNTSGNVTEISRWSECSLQRNVEAFRIYKRSNAKIVVTGGNFLSQEDVSYAQKAAEFLFSLGVPKDDVVIIANGENTVEEVAAVAKTLSQTAIGIVSSATHISRLSIIYSNYPFAIHFYPVDYHSSGSLSPFLALPSLSALRSSQHAFYEYFALAKLYLFER